MHKLLVKKAGGALFKDQSFGSPNISAQQHIDILGGILVTVGVYGSGGPSSALQGLSG